MRYTKKRLWICLLLLILNLSFIWGNSLLPGEISGALSDWVKGILDVLRLNKLIDQLWDLEQYIRDYFRRTA